MVAGAITPGGQCRSQHGLRVLGISPGTLQARSRMREVLAQDCRRRPDIHAALVHGARGPPGGRAGRPGRMRRVHVRPGTRIGQVSASASNRHVVVGADGALVGGTSISIGVSLGLSHCQGESRRHRRLAPGRALTLLGAGACSGGSGSGARPARTPGGRTGTSLVAHCLGRRWGRDTRARAGIATMLNRGPGRAAKTHSRGGGRGRGHGHPTGVRASARDPGHARDTTPELPAGPLCSGGSGTREGPMLPVRPSWTRRACWRRAA